MAPALTLHYFPIPGRAETARLILTLGNVEFNDKRIPFSEWPEVKPKMPFGTVPVLEVDGKMLAQMAAIDRYCASLAGMLPTDPWQLALADQAYFFLEDLYQPLAPVMALRQKPDAAEEDKQKAYEELLAPDSTFRQRLALLEAFLEKREGCFMCGEQLTYVDLAIFMALSTFQSGWLPGMPHDILSGYPTLKAFRHSIASLPAVAAFYAKEEDEVRQAGFRPDGEAEAAP